MRSLVIKQLTKATEPLGTAERALIELCELHPGAEKLKEAKKRVAGVGEDLKLFLKRKEYAIEHYKQNAASSN